MTICKDPFILYKCDNDYHAYNYFYDDDVKMVMIIIIIVVVITMILNVPCVGHLEQIRLSIIIDCVECKLLSISGVNVH